MKLELHKNKTKLKECIPNCENFGDNGTKIYDWALEIIEMLWSEE